MDFFHRVDIEFVLSTLLSGTKHACEQTRNKHARQWADRVPELASADPIGNGSVRIGDPRKSPSKSVKHNRYFLLFCLTLLDGDFLGSPIRTDPFPTRTDPLPIGSSDAKFWRPAKDHEARWGRLGLDDYMSLCLRNSWSMLGNCRVKWVK